MGSGQCRAHDGQARPAYSGQPCQQKGLHRRGAGETASPLACLPNALYSSCCVESFPTGQASASGCSSRPGSSGKAFTPCMQSCQLYQKSSHMQPTPEVCANCAAQVWRGTLWGKPVAVKLLPLLDVDERQLECLRREVAVLLHTTGECKQVSAGHRACWLQPCCHSMARCRASSRCHWGHDTVTVNICSCVNRSDVLQCIYCRPACGVSLHLAG
jgi:hypothetical protein